MDNIFSMQLQKLRKEHGVTQETLAKHLGVSPQAVSKWENGSYPDGDLLPKIADFFDVSIDFLYGRANGNVPVVQQIMDELQERIFGPEGSDKKYFEQMLDYAWAIQSAAWKNNKSFFNRPKLLISDGLTVSETSADAGFTYMRLNRDLEYFFLVKQPDDGFAPHLKVTEKTCGLFSFLGDKDNLKILQYMLSLKGSEAVRAKTIAKLLKISVEKAEKARGGLCKFNGTFYKGSIIDENNRSENIYQLSQVKAVAPLMLLICADMMIYPPDGYQNQIGSRNEAWFNRDDLGK